MPRTNFSVVEVVVEGSRGDEYHVQIVGGSPVACDCPNYIHRAGPDGSMCKHMRARSGRKAVGVTRCARCRAWLTPAEINAQPTPEQSDPHVDQLLSRLCDVCR
jgi:hypothetical protein